MTYDDLKKNLKKEDKVVVWACNNCIKFRDGLGGRESMNKLADKLEQDGYDIVRRELIGASCLLDLVRKRRTDEAAAKAFEESTVILPLTCEDGYDNVKHVFSDKKVLNLTKTIGLGVFSTKKGMCVNYPFEGTGLEPSVDGITLTEAAKKMGLHSGPY
ncbi:MAG TPA: hypothetical protein ENN25_01590 [Euryarchaeota archaeon]|nr:hypothetical protein [Euryarchaeota archaeon]